MPYKRTGNPPGRPRKVVAEQAKVERPAKKTLSRARKSFRAVAERLTPATGVQVFDSRGRPRHKPSSQRRIA